MEFKDILIITILSFTLGIVFNLAFDKRDKKLETAMQKYEKCVQDEYNTTPMVYYYEHGEMPYCE